MKFIKWLIWQRLILINLMFPLDNISLQEKDSFYKSRSAQSRPKLPMNSNYTYQISESIIPNDSDLNEDLYLSLGTDPRVTPNIYSVISDKNCSRLGVCFHLTQENMVQNKFYLIFHTALSNGLRN